VAKKKKDLPVFVVVEMKPWQDKILGFMLKVMRVPGTAWVIALDDTGFNYDGEDYQDEKTGLKISKKVANGTKLT
jgi:hypothetical protein